jgi:hypothetical protein
MTEIQLSFGSPTVRLSLQSQILGAWGHGSTPGHPYIAQGQSSEPRARRVVPSAVGWGHHERVSRHMTRNLIMKSDAKRESRNEGRVDSLITRGISHKSVHVFIVVIGDRGTCRLG